MPRHKGANYRRKKMHKRQQVLHRSKKLFFKICKVGVMGVILAAVIAISYYGYKKTSNKIEESSLFNINKVIVKGDISLPAEKIMEMCGIKRGEKLYKIKAKEVANRICRNIWIESAKCIKKWYGVVVLEVKERKPIALINIGEINLIDRNGVILPIKNKEESGDLPLIYVPNKTYTKDGIKYLDGIYVKHINYIVDKLNNPSIKLLEKVSQIEINDSDTYVCKISDRPVFVKMDYYIGERQLKNLKYLLNILTDCGDSIKTIVDIRYNNIAYVNNVLLANKDL